ncbi:MAG: SMC-Scp complex subunit ScpB [Candidatus Lokiarchaeota archaeon]|nr:SMC-Scp complex subunit ScpB [Candidatus Lokiarchaeota archaeon]
MGKKAAKPAAQKDEIPAGAEVAAAHPVPPVQAETVAVNEALQAPEPVTGAIEAPAGGTGAPEAPATSPPNASPAPAIDAPIASASGVGTPAPGIDSPETASIQPPEQPGMEPLAPVPDQAPPAQPATGEQPSGMGGAPVDVDDDEVLDEIKPKTPGDAKKPSPEQFKKDFTKNQIEAVLFVSGQAVSAEEISVKLNVGKKIVEEMLEKLAMEYLERSSALEIAKVADKYILQLKPEFTSSVKSFATGGLIREAVMRTLTIIAAKQPILQSDLSKIRSSAGEHLKELSEMGLVKSVPKGRSKELTTTDKFADMFGFSRDVNQMKEQIKIYLTAATKDEGE